MRPRKVEEKLKGVVLQVRVTAAEAEQFRAQATARKMAVSSYLRFLLLEDADKLSAEGKLRKTQDGAWEVFLLGNWQSPEVG
jgi:hypothetical protein